MSLLSIDPVYVFYAAVVGVIVIICDAVYLLGFGSGAYRKTVNRRLSRLQEAGDREAAIVQLRRERHLGEGLARARLAVSFMRLLTQSGLALSLPKLGLICLSAGAVVFIACAAMGRFELGAGAAAFVTFVLPFFVLGRLRRRRRAKFTDQLPEAIDLIVRSLRAGHPVASAIKLTAREFRDPLGSEFGMVDDEITYGLDLETAMRNLYDRLGQEDLPLFIASVAIQSSSGGNLTEILGNLSDVIRARVKMRRKVRALSSEGRASALILSSVPIALFFLINWMSPSFYGDHWSNPWMVRGLVGAAVWMGLGNLVMRRMINFKF